MPFVCAVELITSVHRINVHQSSPTEHHLFNKNTNKPHTSKHLPHILGFLALRAGLRSLGTLLYSSPSAFGFVRLAIASIFRTWLIGTHVEEPTASLSHPGTRQAHKQKRSEITKPLQSDSHPVNTAALPHDAGTLLYVSGLSLLAR